MTTTAPMLHLADVHTYYGDAHVLRGVSLEAARGSIVALLGRNGAGKTTTMRSITGLTTARSGRIEVAGESVTGLAPHQISRLGVALVPQGRRIFAGLTVEENLQVPFARNGRRAVAAGLARAYELFPRLHERRAQDGATLSGGEQQMLAIARALMTEPTLLLLDEPSEGLAPGVVAQLASVIKELRDAGLTIVLVEQIVTLALELADYVYVLGRGQITYSGLPTELGADQAAMRTHLGLGQ